METFQLVMQFVQMFLKAAPDIVQGAENAKKFLAAAFGAGMISAAQQNAGLAWIAGQTALAAAGYVEPGLVVRPDPTTPATP